MLSGKQACTGRRKLHEQLAAGLYLFRQSILIGLAHCYKDLRVQRYTYIYSLSFLLLLLILLQTHHDRIPQHPELFKKLLGGWIEYWPYTNIELHLTYLPFFSPKIGVFPFGC